MISSKKACLNKMLKNKRVGCCIVDISQIVVKFILSEAACCYLPRNLPTAFLRSESFEKMKKKQFLQSITHYDVISLSKAVKFLQVDRSDTSFRLGTKALFSVKKCKI